MDNKENCRYPLDPLVDVMAKLRSDDGCPWDKEQTHDTLKQYLVEETYEVMEALDTKDTHKICDELGDLLLQIAFHAQIAAEDQKFGMNDVINAITQKMIRRHPHVFGNIKVQNSDEVLVNWDKIKSEERGGLDKQKSLLANIPKGLPALNRATKIQAKVARVGFDWPDYKGALGKVAEETNELNEAIKAGNYSEMYAELGDLLFAVVNLSRLLDIDAEGALTKTNNKFTKRFQYIEAKASEMGVNLSETSLAEMDKWWDEAKCLELTKDGKNNK